MLWQRNDAALVQEVLSGRHDQFELLVERHLPRVLAIAGARVQCRADADDAAQEAFLKAYTSLDTLKDHARFATWLATIVRNVCATLQRARREVNRLDPEAARSCFSTTSPASKSAKWPKRSAQGLASIRKALTNVHLEEGQTTKVDFNLP